MDLDQGCWIWVWENPLSKWKGWIHFLKRKSGSACFGTKMVPCLWRADLSFMNSVTGSGNVEKCSNILQDTRLERPATCKHSSLFWALVNYGRKKFYNIGLWSTLSGETNMRKTSRFGLNPELEAFLTMIKTKCLLGCHAMAFDRMTFVWTVYKNVILSSAVTKTR